MIHVGRFVRGQALEYILDLGCWLTGNNIYLVLYSLDKDLGYNLHTIQLAIDA